MHGYAGFLIIDGVHDNAPFAKNLVDPGIYRVYTVAGGAAVQRFLESYCNGTDMAAFKTESFNRLDLLEHIKMNANTTDIPVILLNCGEERYDAVQKKDVSCDEDYAVQPFLQEESFCGLKENLHISRQSQAYDAEGDELKLFCSAVSHDLKSPLNVINMLTDMLQAELGENPGDGVLKILDMIRGKSKKLTIMIERLLEFSKMCNAVPNVCELDIRSMVEEIFCELQALEPHRCITFNCEPLPVIAGDEVLVNILLANVISNAVKFTKVRERAEITIRALPDSEYHVISIQDNGIGFDMAYSDKLFKVFQRLHEGEEFEGSGVGLALVDRIMRLHGGKVEAFGKVGHGVCIKLYFIKKQKQVIT